MTIREAQISSNKTGQINKVLKVSVKSFSYVLHVC